jgi:thiamine biosynthesis lipoprotein
LQLVVQPVRADWLREDADIMGTRISVELFHADPAVARQGINAVLEEMRRIDASMSPYIASSELAQVNENAHRQAVPVSKELFALIQRSLHFSELTGGAFDITFASAGFLYDYRRRIRPDETRLEQAANLINYRNLVLDSDKLTVAFSKPGVRIDLGGIAKGHAVDRCISLLRALGIEHAMVTAGGDSRVSGDRWGRPWTIGVQDPRKDDELVAVIPLQDVAVSTSGDYQRFFEEDGVRYHHIINPDSGTSAKRMRSVTIIAPDATTADALSTSVFVLGTEAGLQLIDKLAEIDAILVDRQGRMHYSGGLQTANKTDDSANPSTPPVTD